LREIQGELEMIFLENKLELKICSVVKFCSSPFFYRCVSLRSKDLPQHFAPFFQAKELEDLFKESNISSGNAIDAANAYSNIELAIQEAFSAAHDAGNAAENATDMSQGLHGRTGESGARSFELLQNARGTLDQAQRELMPHLQKARNSVEEVQQMNLKSDERDSRINRYVHGKWSD
jgi:hypothetical protein